jgi:hypothetical protein
LETLDKIRACFEGKEAIYIEKGALRVRVSNIRYDDLKGEAVIEAEIEEILTPGLPVSLPGYDRRDRPRPFRWKIGTNVKVHPYYSRDFWSSPPYVGWSMHFSPEIIEGVVNLALGFPQDQSPDIGYRRIQSFINRQTCESLKDGVKRAEGH